MTKKEVQLVLSVMDRLGLNLVGHKHEWAQDERNKYKRAINVLVKEEAITK